ncbi:MAG TPA: metallophosphoesterase family protein [Nitrososphaeraceae archaeon]
MTVLVQISDIHIGSLYDASVFDKIVQEVNSMKPDAIIVTGDITDEGILPQFELARVELERFKCKELIVLPGNHDYRHTGYLLFKKFFPSTQTYDMGDVLLITLHTPRPDRDEGEVGYRQLLWMQKIIEKFKGQRKKIIVAMHHHLIGIPDTGTDKIIVLDAGDALRVCLESKVDLVVCGHKHRPWVWKLGDLQIAYAGTASSSRFRGFFQNTYNIIDVKKDNLSVNLKIVGGKNLPLSDLVSKYQPFLST